MDRRGFVRAALALPWTARLVRASAPRRIVVVGAGIAGLGAARDLAAMGHQVTVVEARDRIGGRIHTSHLWPDLPLDLGASWIHGVRGNPLTVLADEVGAGRVQTSYEAAVLLGPMGQPIDPDLSGAASILDMAWRGAEDLDRETSVQDVVKATAAWQKANADQRRLVEYLVNATLEQEYGGSAGRLSALHGTSGKVFPGEDVLFPKGFGALCTGLARGLDIRLNQAVTRLAPGRVTLADGQGLMADQIVLTVPLGILRAGSIRFDRPLDPSRQRAIEGLEMGLLNKLWLRFDRVVWPDEVDWIEWLGPKPGHWAEWLSLAPSVGVPVLLGFNAADQAAEIEALSDAETVAAATAALRAMFGSRFPAPIAAQITRWGQDVWARGSYSFNAVGTSAKTRKALAGPDWDGALWFAGEACEPDYYGTAHGALLSGRAMARRLAKG